MFYFFLCRWWCNSGHLCRLNHPALIRCHCLHRYIWCWYTMQVKDVTQCWRRYIAIVGRWRLARWTDWRHWQHIKCKHRRCGHQWRPTTAGDAGASLLIPWYTDCDNNLYSRPNDHVFSWNWVSPRVISVCCTFSIYYTGSFRVLSVPLLSTLQIHSCTSAHFQFTFASIQVVAQKARTV